MIEEQGLSAALGIGIGKLCFVPYQKRSIPEYRINKRDISSELKRFRRALELVDEELHLLQENLDEQEASFITAHRMILQDPLLHDTMETWLYEKLHNVESLLFHFASTIEHELRGMDNPVFAERGSDMQDLSHRVIDALLGQKRDNSLGQIRQDSIVIAYDLYPSDAVALDSRYIKGIVTETGGITSHTAILARAYGIPAVLGIENLLGNLHREGYSNNFIAIVDGFRGKVLFDPDAPSLAHYRLAQQQSQASFQQDVAALRPKVRSRDAQDIFLYANIGSLGELSNPFFSATAGIGLFRSELLFLEKIPSEEEQYRAYVQILDSVHSDQELTIRTIDLGGDKVPVTGLLTESNPLLGCRATRLAMAYPQKLFCPQLRAIYRAAAHSLKHKLARVRIMLPMISSHVELLEARVFIAGTLRELEKEGVAVPRVPVGIMVELPSAALCSDIIAKDVDFFSIGTNDLAQYTLGIDRSNEKVAHLYDPFQFSVLKLIEMTIVNGKREGIPVSMCGEMASDPCATALLLGLGLRHFSMSSYSLPGIAHAICHYDIPECEELARRYISMPNREKARKYLLDWHNTRNIEISIRE